MLLLGLVLTSRKAKPIQQKPQTPHITQLNFSCFKMKADANMTTEKQSIGVGEKANSLTG